VPQGSGIRLHFAVGSQQPVFLVQIAQSVSAPTLSVIIPVYNEGEAIPELDRRLQVVLIVHDQRAAGFVGGYFCQRRLAGRFDGAASRDGRLQPSYGVVSSRETSDTRWLREMVARDGTTSFSIVPLWLATWLGVCAGLIAVGAAGWAPYVRLQLERAAVQGWTTMVIVIALGTSAQLG
jgi:hypothetical protein